ncbi:MAG: ParA family protein [Actinobacteria bacterium]|nr:ParA family protein [Actinomycetota bacterium]
MHSIAVIALKGGVGKTTISLGLAGAAMQQGLRTLVVDIDPQANATLGLNPPKFRFTSSDVLADAREGVAGDAVVPSGWGEGVDVIPAESALERRNTPGDAESALRLRRSLRGVADSYDLVIYDCPPSLGEITRNGLAAATHGLVVTEPGYFSLRGAEQALDAIGVVRDSTNLRLRALGIVVNRMRPRVREHRSRLAELAQAYPQLLLDPPVPDRSAIQMAQGAGVPLHVLGKRSAGDTARAFSELLDQARSRMQPMTIKV